MKHALTLICASLLPTVLGNGYLLTISVDGVNYTGTGASDSVIRQVNSPNPIKDPNSVDMSCGPGAANITAISSARAKPGSTIGITWASGQPPGPWSDSVGPIMTYIAFCDIDCSNFHSLDASWFKIDQAGFDNSTDATNPAWIQGTTFHVGKPFSMTLPADIPPGNYLLRHEVIGLQRASTIHGADFYPACSQINVVADTSAKTINIGPAVAFPGAYNYRDPGILIDVSNLSVGQYPFPGPKVVTAFTVDGPGGSNSSSVASGTFGTSTSDSGVTAMVTSTTASQLDTATITPPPTTTLQSATASDPASTSDSSDDAASSDDDDDDCGDEDDPDDGADDDPDGSTDNGSNDNTNDGPDGSTGDSPDDSADDDSSDPTVTVTETIFITTKRPVHTVIATTLVTVTGGDPAATVVSASSTASPSADDLDSGSGNSRRGWRASRRSFWPYWARR